MSIVRWDPFSDLERFTQDLSRWWPFEKKVPGITPWSPMADIKETDSEIIVKTDLPGMKMEDINVSISEGKLNISGERKLEKEEKKDFVRVERAYGSFNRSFTLGIPVKEDKIRASYKDGILEITLPKAEAKKAKRIEIQSN